jgi:hypothetical protein
MWHGISIYDIIITVERKWLFKSPYGLFRKCMGNCLNSMARPWLEINTRSEKEQE